MAYSYTKEQSINIIRKVLESISSGNVNKMQYASEELYDLIICNLNPNLEIQETNNKKRFIVRREFRDMTLYAYAYHHGYFTWGVKEQAIKLDTKIEAEALIAEMCLANDDSVSVEELDKSK